MTVNDVDIDLLEKSITEERLKCYKYSDFKNIQPIGQGSSGYVVSANWKTTDRVFALKSFNYDEVVTFKEVAKELKLHRIVDFHENIIRIFGITEKEADEARLMRRYLLVLEFADSGTLNNYLNKHFNELDWKEKNKLAFQLASAVAFIHDCDIIHRDLHANNILVHKKNIKLADFGLSRKIDEKSSNTSKIFGVIPYTDPKKLNDQNYKLNRKSDVYSIGVLMWQISSGYRPFRDVDYDLGLSLAILNGKREKIIDETPVEYSNLYEECWKDNPEERPKTQKVGSILSTMISPKQSNVNIDIVLNEDCPIEMCQLNSKSDDEIIDINKSLIIESVELRNSSSSQNQGVFQSNVIDLGNDSSRVSSSISYQATELSIIKSSADDNIIDNINNKIANELIKYIINEHDKGVFTFDQIEQIINQQIAVENLIKWLLKNQVKSEYIFFLGLFYYYNIDIEEDSNKAFELFLEASKNNCSIAQVYLAKCYNDGYGTECNKELAFNWYQTSVENGSIIGQFYLGYCYELGIGTHSNEKKSVYWYKKATNNGNTTAKLYLAECYRLGKGVRKNESKAFEYYKVLAKKEIADAQFQLGNCFYYGVGIELNKDQALYWYRKSTINGNIVANYILENYYNEKSKNKTNKVMKFKELVNQLGLYYIGKILMKTSYEKSLYYFQKAANDGYKVAQYNLGNCYILGKGVTKNERKAFELFKKSAGQGYINAKFQLGYCYDEGIGTDINKVKAYELYKVAAERGIKKAQYNLSFLYELGEGVDKDEKKAFELIKKLAEKEDLDAQSQLGYYYSNGIGTKVNKEKAFELYKIAAEKGDNDAQYNLSLLYELGEGVNKDEKKAFELIKELAEKEDPDAQFKLGYYYSNGIGTKVNKEKAFELYKIAVGKGDNDAQFSLSLLFQLGKEGYNDEEETFEIIKKLAKKKYLNAQFKLGYYIGIGIERIPKNTYKGQKRSAKFWIKISTHFF